MRNVMNDIIRLHDLFLQINSRHFEALNKKKYIVSLTSVLNGVNRLVFSPTYGGFECTSTYSPELKMRGYRFNLLNTLEGNLLVRCTYGKDLVLDNIDVQEFHTMTDDTKFQYGVLFPDYTLYHDIFCYTLDNHLRIHMEPEAVPIVAEDLEKILKDENKSYSHEP